MPWTLKLTSLVFAAQPSLLKQYENRPSSSAVKEWSPELTDFSLVMNFVGAWICSDRQNVLVSCSYCPYTHPEVDIEIANASKLPVADLKCDCHLVVHV